MPEKIKLGHYPPARGLREWISFLYKPFRSAAAVKSELNAVVPAGGEERVNVA